MEWLTFEPLAPEVETWMHCHCGMGVTEAERVELEMARALGRCLDSDKSRRPSDAELRAVLKRWCTLRGRQVPGNPVA